MKNFFFITLLSLCSFTVFAQSNVRLGYQGVFYPHIGETFFGPIASVEANMGNHFSLNLNIGYLKDHQVIAVNSDIITRSLKFEPEIRFFPRQGLKGFFVGARMSYSNFSSVLKQGKERVSFPTPGEDSVFGFGGVLGFQANFNEHLMLSTSVGLGVESEYGEAMPSLTIGMGYRF